MDYFYTKMCFGKFWKQQKNFLDINFFFEIQREVNVNLEKVLIFLHPWLSVKGGLL